MDDRINRFRISIIKYPGLYIPFSKVSGYCSEIMTTSIPMKGQNGTTVSFGTDHKYVNYYVETGEDTPPPPLPGARAPRIPGKTAPP